MKKQSAYIVCEYIFIFYIIKNILFINILNFTVVLEKLKKYYRHANSNAYPITTSKFYLFYLLIVILIIDY